MSWNFSPADWRVRLFILTVFVATCVGKIADAGVTVPGENEDASVEIRSYTNDIAAGHFDSAADHYWNLATTHDRDVVSRPDGTLIGIRAALDAIPPDAMAKVAGQLRARHGVDAAALIGAATASPRFRPGDLYAAAMQCRHTAESDSALNTAADRAARQGDSITALELLKRPAPESTVSVLPFSASWFGRVSGYAVEKSIPVLAGDTVFVVNNRREAKSPDSNLIAVSTTGETKWRVQVSHPAGFHHYWSIAIDRGAVSIPAVVTDTDGNPQIVIARFFGGTDVGTLSGYRASDGRPLWSTAETMPGVSVLSSATVTGRFAYCVCIEASANQPQQADLQLIAVDVTDGKPIWRSHIADVSEIPPPDQFSNFPWLGYFLDQSPPLVKNGSVVIAPGVGAVFSVDRFDGAIQWIHPYPQAMSEDGQVRIFELARKKPGDPPRPMQPYTQILRWTSAPVLVAGIVVTAPQDTTFAFGLEFDTGKTVWQSNTILDGCPVAVTDTKVIWSGSQGNTNPVRLLNAIDPKSGQGTWIFNPPNGSHLGGMPVVRGEKLIVPTDAGRVVLDAAQGIPGRDRGGIDFDQVISTDAGRASMQQAGMADQFTAAHK